MTTELIRELILEGPCQPGLKENFNFKLDLHNRRFNVSWYYKSENEGKQLRDWLIYSPRANKMFCFSCWLMSSHNKSVWADPNKGSKNFKKGIEKITKHEGTEIHRDMQNKYIISKLRIMKNQTVIQEQLQKENQELKKNREMLIRIFDLILHLAKQNISFRGHSEIQNSSNSGNFLEFLKLFKKYDIVLMDSLSNKKKTLLILVLKFRMKF